MFGLEYLIAPCDKERFLSDHFGCEAFLIPGEGDKFAEIFSWTEINQLVNYGSDNYNLDRLIMDEKNLDRSEFAQLGHWINEGATYVLNYLQNRDPVIEQFTRILSGELNQQVSVNCYVSAPAKRGFELHYDSHDVFIIQLYGVKEWAVFAPTMVNPMEQMKAYLAPKPETDPYLEHQMTAGDVLYIPRGHWHNAVASSVSVHLTVGVNACTPIDFIRWFADSEMWMDERLRQNFPVVDNPAFLGHRDTQELEQFIEKFRAQIIEKLSGEYFQQRFARFVMERNGLSSTMPISLPEQFLLEECISVDTEFEVPLGQKIILQQDPKKNVGVVIARGITVELDGCDEKFLSAIFHRTPDSIKGEKVKQEFPDMEAEKICSVLLKLAEGGVIQLKTRRDET